MKLSDVCEFIADCPHSTAPDEGKGFPLIRTPNVGKGRLLLDNVQRVSKAVYDKRNMRAVPQDNDLIFAREAPAGNVAIIKYGEKVCLGQRTVLLRPDIHLADPDFLTYYLLTPVPQNRLLGGANGSTVNHVNLPTIRNLPIDIPPLPIQQKIGRILSAYDDLIENHRRQIRLLKEGAERLYKEWFVKNYDPRWAFYKLGNFGDIITGKTPSTSRLEYWGQEIPFVTIPDMHGNIFINKTEKLLTKQGADSQKNKILYSGTLLVSCIGTVGLVSITTGICETNQQINALVPFNPVTIAFLYFKIRGLRRQLEGLGSNGATMINVNKDKFSSIQISCPPLEMIEAFSRLANPIFEEIKLLNRQVISLQEARDRLLPKLMSGEVKV